MPKSFFVEVMGCRLEIVQDDDGKFIVPVGFRGLGGALKPAFEPALLFRKPLVGTVAENVLAHGTGALNIDGCRVPTDDVLQLGKTGLASGKFFTDGEVPEIEKHQHESGRFPANLIHDGSDEVLALFPDSNGSGGSVPNVKVTGYGDGIGTGESKYLGGERTKHNSGSGSAGRFFKQVLTTEDIWEGVELPPKNVSTAEKNLLRQRQAAGSALIHAVNAALPEGLRCKSVCLEPSTSATANELRRIESGVTQTILSIEKKFWLASKPAKLSLSLSPVSVAVSLEPTGTTTITISHWKSDGSADPVIFNITQQSLEAGERGCEPSTSSRFIYTPKASKKDRGTGNHHPTVKPTDLMAYLCRLVTPPGGIVLDPFMGSGSTGKAAMREGFGFVGIEMDEGYYDIAKNRVGMEVEL